MRIIRLEILNLASLDRREGEVIDFTTGVLGDTSIFSIVGPMGSGKSTILDAICLALYNRAPRYPRKKGDRNQHIDILAADNKEEGRLAPTDSRNILTRGRKTGYSKLTFETNNGNVYRAEWHVRLKRTAYDNVKTFLCRIVHKDDEYVEETADWEDIPAIIGLDYEQFLRTVLIAQGSFAAFLKAKDEERYELLEKLIGGQDKYIELADKITQKRNETAEEFKNIKGKIAAYQQFLISDDELVATEAEIARLEEELQQRQKQIETLTVQVNWYAQEDAIKARIKGVEQDLAVAEKEREEMSPLRQLVETRDAAQEGIALVGERDKIENDLKLTRDSKDKEVKEKERLDSIAAELSKEVENKFQNLTAAKTESERITPILVETRRIVVEINGLEQRRVEASRVLTSTESVYKAAVSACEENRANIDRLQRKIAESDRNHALLIERIAEEEKAIGSKIDVKQRELSEAQKDIADLDAKEVRESKVKADVYVNILNRAISIRQNYNAHKSRINEDEKDMEKLSDDNRLLADKLAAINYTALKKEIETLDASLGLLKSENVENLRSTLVDDSPCPVCGATHHPYSHNIAASEAITGLENLVKDKKKELEKCISLEKELQKSCERNNGKLEALKRSVESAGKELSRLGKEWDETLYMRSDLSEDPTVLQQELAAAQDQQIFANARYEFYVAKDEKIKILHGEFESLREEFLRLSESNAARRQESEQELTALRNKLEVLQGNTILLVEAEKEKKQEFERINEQYQALIVEIAGKNGKIKELIGENTPDRVENEIKIRIQKAEKELESSREKQSKCNLEIHGVAGRIETLNSAINNSRIALTAKESELALWLGVYNRNSTAPLSEEQLHKLAQDNRDWQQIRRELRRLDDRCTSIKATLANENANWEQMQVNRPEETKATLVAKIDDLRRHDDAQLVAAKMKVKAHREASEALGSLKDEYNAASQLAEDWKAIAESVGNEGKTLRKIAQTYTLRFLIEHANEEIRKFNSRYELVHVKNSLGMRIIDHDRGDDIRDVTTLSGGETFIVSLGLALGLSSLSSRNVSFDNLFIDEGFGNLDADTLSTVIDSLAMLQMRQGKKVGVISHTDTMSERIGTRIRLIKNGTSGSSRIEIGV